MRFTFTKQEKLKSKKLIQQLFEEGNSFSKFPLRIVYLKIEHNSNYSILASFSVPKRKCKRAVDRNRIKRLLREAYRLHKHTIYQSVKDKYIIMFTYLDEKEHKYVDIEDKMVQLLDAFIKKTKKETNEEDKTV